MKVFEKNTQIVMKTLEDNGLGQSVLTQCRRCFLKFKMYLQNNKADYSHENADRWLNTLYMCHSTMNVYRAAVIKLNDVYEFGHVRFSSISKVRLSDEFNQILDTYLTEITGYKQDSLAYIRVRCRYFLKFLQIEKKMISLTLLDYRSVIDFYSEGIGILSKADKCLYKGTVQDFLHWLAARGVCSPGFAILLTSNYCEKIVSLSVFSEKDMNALNYYGKNALAQIPPEDVLKMAKEFVNALEKLGYATTMKDAAKYTLSLLYLFLDINSWGYTPEIGGIWFAAGKHMFGTNAPMSQRVIMLFADFVNDGDILHPEKVYRSRPSSFDGIPEWCKPVVSAFLEQKKKEEKKKSTIDMYRSSIVRFCIFLGNSGLSSFSELTTDNIKEFNRQDMHSSIDGKNAYNVRIRKFIFYLADRGLISSHFMINAVPCTAAPSIKIVHTLTDEEYSCAEQYGKNALEGLELRDRAILFLGLKMGMRCTDIVSLTFDQINWEESSIHFLQKKTDVEKILPMPTEVGNAIFHYITKARPKSGCTNIFITHKAPYRSITRNVCNRIFHNVWTEWEHPGIAFHVTRKTYATMLFQNGVSYSEVADLLGHTTNDTVYKYISLDEERMRLCPLSLEENGILMKGGF